MVYREDILSPLELEQSRRLHVQLQSFLSLGIP